MKTNNKGWDIIANISFENIIAENKLAYANYDGFPVTEMHALIIPKRHVKDYFDITNNELISCDSLLKKNKINSKE